MALTADWICVGLRPSAKATSRAWKACMPTAGSTLTLTIELRLFRRDVLDLHAALRGGDDHHALRLAVEHEAQIELLGDGDAAFDIEAVDDLARGAGLVRDQLLAEEFVGGIEHFVLRAAELDAARLAAAAGVDLGLDDPELAADLARPVGRLLGAVGQRALGNGHAEAGQDFLGLILVNVHVECPQAAFLRAAALVAPR